MAGGKRGRICPRGEQSAAYRHGYATDQNGRRPGEYLSWRAMRSRCENPKDPAYPRYGGRGIKVCDRWQFFENFLADMGPRPEGKSLDRWPDNNGHYEPSNCRWATRQEQGANTRTTNNITVNGVTKCLAEWSRETGLDTAAIRYRIVKLGMTPEMAVTTPRLTARKPKSRIKGYA